MAGEDDANGETRPRARARGRRHDAVANRERILQVAAVTVKREGVRVPMATIAAAAGVGIGTVYRHFATREELMTALTERSFELVLANARLAAEHHGGACEAVRGFLQATIADRREFVLPWHGGPSVGTDRLRGLQAEVWRLVGLVVARGIEEGSLRADLTAADVIQFGAMLAQPLPNATDWDRVARRQTEIYLSGIRAPSTDVPGAARP